MLLIVPWERQLDLNVETGLSVREPRSSLNMPTLRYHALNQTRQTSPSRRTQLFYDWQGGSSVVVRDH